MTHFYHFKGKDLSVNMDQVTYIADDLIHFANGNTLPIGDENLCISAMQRPNTLPAAAGTYLLQVFKQPNKTNPSDYSIHIQRNQIIGWRADYDGYELSPAYVPVMIDGYSANEIKTPTWIIHPCGRAEGYAQSYDCESEDACISEAISMFKASQKEVL